MSQCQRFCALICVGDVTVMATPLSGRGPIGNQSSLQEKKKHSGFFWNDIKPNSVTDS